MKCYNYNIIAIDSVTLRSNLTFKKMQIAFPRKDKKNTGCFIHYCISPHVSFQPLYFNEFGQQLLNGATKMRFVFGGVLSQHNRKRQRCVLHLPKRFQPLTKIQIQLIANLTSHRLMLREWRCDDSMIVTKVEARIKVTCFSRVSHVQGT